MTSLHQYIINNDYAGFEQVLKSGADCNQLGPLMGNAPLHIAAQQSSPKWAEALLKAGAFINLQTPKHGVTPLMVAVWHRKPDVVKVLLAQWDINIEIISTFGLKAEQLTDFGASEHDAFGQQQAKELQAHFAAYRQALAVSEAKMAEFAVVTDQSFSDEQKAVALKALEGSLSLNRTSAVTCSGNDEHTAVMIAARDGLTRSLQVLMENGGDQTIPDHYMKAIPLHKAAYNGRADVIRLLAQFPGFVETLNAQGPNNGYTPLHDAVWHGHTEAAEVLLKAGADTAIKGFDGKTPLALAREYHYTDLIELLEE